MQYLLFIITSVMIMNCSSNKQVVNDQTKVEKSETQLPDYIITKNGERLKRVVKSDKEWKKELSDQEYYILRKKGTERSFTSPLNDNKEEGIYKCAGCETTLFESETKFDSGTGWPSFFKPYDNALIQEDTDYKIGYARTEVLCARCGGHLGHVFNDGPKPTGQRYCINGVALKFEKSQD